MKKNKPKLDSLLREYIHPNNLVGLSSVPAELQKKVEEECDHLRSLVFHSFVCTSPCEKIRPLEIIILSNTIYRYTMQSGRFNELQPDDLGFLYRKTLNSLEEILTQQTCLMDNENGKSADLPLTQYKASRVRNTLKRKISTIDRELLAYNVDATLRYILKKGLHEILRRKKLKLSDARYVSSLIFSIDNSRPKKTINLVFLLCKYNFNSDDYFEYVYYHCNAVLMREPSISDKLSIINSLSEKVEVLPIYNGLGGWSNSRKSLKMRLKGFIREKRRMTDFHRKLERRSSDRLSDVGARYRLHLGLSVAQLGLFIRVLIAAGILKNKELGKVFTFFADNAYTDNCAEISTKSLKNKSLNIEFPTVLKMRKLFRFKLDWLDENFNSADF